MTDCETCGQPHLDPSDRPTCSGHVKNDRSTFDPATRRAKPLPKPRPCRRLRPEWADASWKCRSHGGAAPQVQAAYERQRAEAQAEQVMRRFGGPIDTTPTEALLDAVRWTAGYVGWLREKVAEIDSDDDLIWGKTREKTGGEDWGSTHEAKPNAWLTLLGEWHDRLVKICAEAIKAGIEERRVRLAEQQGQLLADVIRRILADLNLSAEQEAMVSDVVPRHLRAVAG